MNQIEKLISEYGNLNFYFKNDMPSGLSGLISDNNVYVNNTLPFEHIYATLAEEIDHYETSVGNIIDYTKYINMKQEIRARRWGYKKLVPFDKLVDFVSGEETVHNYDLAEEFGVPGEYINEVVNMYRTEGKL